MVPVGAVRLALPHLDGLHGFAEMSSAVAEEVVAPVVGAVHRGVAVGVLAAAGDEGEFVGDYKMPLKLSSEVFEL